MKQKSIGRVETQKFTIDGELKLSSGKKVKFRKNTQQC